MFGKGPYVAIRAAGREPRRAIAQEVAEEIQVAVRLSWLGVSWAVTRNRQREQDCAQTSRTQR